MRPRRLAAAGRPLARPPVAAFALALGARLALIDAVPWNYSMDAYERWAGRDHLLVHDWLPATQAVIWAVAALGGGTVAARVALSVVAALAAAAGAAVAEAVGGRGAGWTFLPVALFPPFLAWSATMYQEGTFLALVLGAIALAEAADRRGSPRLRLAADLLAGAAALCRYEGWLFVPLYVLWQGRRSALRALWGMALWVGLRWGLGVRGYAPSPVDFADWNGLADRFDPARYREELRRFYQQARHTGLLHLAAAGLVGLAWGIARRDRRVALLGAMLAVQVAAVLGWMAGLETVIYRMQVIGGVLLGVLAAIPLGWAWRRGWVARLALAGPLLFAAWRFDRFGTEMAAQAVHGVRWEVRLARRMMRCPDCAFEVAPRRGFGTRDRHDGCQVLQGLTGLRAGVDFRCLAWPEQDAPAHPTHRARWRRGGYVVERLADAAR